MNHGQINYVDDSPGIKSLETNERHLKLKLKKKLSQLNDQLQIDLSNIREKINTTSSQESLEYNTELFPEKK